MVEKAKRVITNDTIEDVWGLYQKGAAFPQIAKLFGITTSRVKNIVDAISEVEPGDIPDIRDDRSLGMTEKEISEKYGLTVTAVRFYTKDVELKKDNGVMRKNFVTEWSEACARLNPGAWERLEDGTLVPHSE